MFITWSIYNSVLIDPKTIYKRGPIITSHAAAPEARLLRVRRLLLLVTSCKLNVRSHIRRPPCSLYNKVRLQMNIILDRYVDIVDGGQVYAKLCLWLPFMAQRLSVI